MFQGASLIDFGGGTGENTIQFDAWGAKCTLIDMNDKALEIAKKVFKTYSKNYGDHKFVQSSIFDYEGSEKYDIVHCRGVLSHTDDKEGAFSKIVTFLKSGGYLIFGDPNKAGGFQNMLQRMIIFKFAKDWEGMIAVAEKLFKEDIDRCQKFGKRTRNTIIFDRFVVPKQDDPSVSEVLKWFRDNDLKYYSSHPPVVAPVLSDSHLNEPKFNPQDFLDIGSFTEAVWLTKRDDDVDQVPEILNSYIDLSEKQFALTDYVGDFSPDTVIDLTELLRKIDDYQTSLTGVDTTRHVLERHRNFFGEVKELIGLLENNDLETIGSYLKTTKHLFRGANGIRHVDYIGYKIK